MRPTRAVIDLSALEHNLQVARKLAGQSEVMPVIKADAYGHGIEAVAERMAGCVVSVACVDEAIILRNNGFSGQICILEGPLSEDDAANACAHDCILVIHSEHQLRWLDELSVKKTIPVWLKVNSGMNRLGFPESLLEVVCQRIKTDSRYQLLGFMTHYACADTSESVTEGQYHTFMKAIESLAEEEHIRSMGNSATLFSHSGLKGDVVRPGIMLYGGSPFSENDGVNLGLKPVMSLRTKVISLQSLRSGEGVGYGLDWIADGDRCIAVIAIGYGDGYPRHAVSGTPVMVNGQRAQIAGRVSMDMVMVDVTGLDVSIGDDVELWGSKLSVDEVARWCGTISYELLTGISKRVPRAYIN